MLAIRLDSIIVNEVRLMLAVHIYLPKCNRPTCHGAFNVAPPAVGRASTKNVLEKGWLAADVSRYRTEPSAVCVRLRIATALAEEGGRSSTGAAERK